MSGRRLTKYKKHKNHAVHVVEHSQPHVHAKRRFNKRAFMAGLLSIAVLITIGLVVFVRIQNNASLTDQTGNKVPEKAALLDQVTALQAGSNAVEQQKLIDRITTTPNFDTDQDLLYVLLVHYIRQSNSVEARKYFTKLQQMYGTSKTFSDKLGTTKSMTALESDVRFIEVQAEQFRESSKNGLVSQ